MLKVSVRMQLIFVLVICLLLAGCGKSVEVQKTALVRSQVVRVEHTGQSASYSGEVRGRYETQLAFQVDGKIIRRNVELGSVVRPGDVLMEIDPKDIIQTVNSSSAQVYSAQSQLRLAESNLTRYKQLYEENAISRAQYEQYQNAYDVAAASVQQATAQYAQGSNKLGYSSLYANNSGIISSINAEAGQVVSAGQSVITLVQDGEREVEISVPENQVENLYTAKQIKVAFWALPNTTVQGKVREISPVADKVSRTYKVRISLVNPPETIKLGMTASVMVAKEALGNTVYIPLAALYQTGDTPGCWVVNNDMVTLRPIKIGVFDDNKVQVLEGLNDGDVIVTAGVHKLQEGQKVRLAGEEL